MNNNASSDPEGPWMPGGPLLPFSPLEPIVIISDYLKLLKDYDTKLK